MPKANDEHLPNLDRYHLQAQAIVRYKCLKSIKQTELSLEDQLFLQNFQCAMSYLWSFPEHSKKYFSGYHF
jgi:hypothetical protein